MIRFLKIWDVKSPERANNEDSGIDLFIPDSFKSVDMKIWDSVLIPSWIRFIIKNWYDWVFKNKSGIALKKGLQVWACVIDSSYRWEVHIHLTKITGDDITLNPWDKIVQMIVRKVELDQPEEITEEEFNKESKTDRWIWGFGSTGVV